MTYTYKKFLLLFFILCMIPVSGVALYNFMTDPYWIFQEKRRWKHYHGLEAKSRFSKGLQIVTRQPETVIIGSSRVYRGFKPIVTSNKHEYYNCGISGLTLSESLGYVKQAVNYSRVKRIILGLDIWMFDKNEIYKSGFEKNTGKLTTLVNSFFKALLSLDSLRDSKYTRDNGEKPFPYGDWDSSGFFQSYPLPPERIKELLVEYEKFFEGVILDFAQIKIFKEIIGICKKNNVELFVYISPLHPEIRKIYEKKMSDFFQEWKEAVIKECQQNKIRVADFSERFSDYGPLEKGSDENWFDYSHFLPPVGEKILKELLTKS